ncbi:MAG: DivIVA domain-containing protein [bacterium]|nr:DivIVA domain-containing protein [bacterium]MBK8128452.1 DivIVA domain-containing protein [bacterium]
MSLNPVEISRHEFTRSLRGYNVTEVRVFLETVAAELGQLQVRLAEAEEAVRTAEKQLSAFRELEKTLRDTVVATQQGMTDARAQAERERETILAEARVEAEKILLDGQRQVSTAREQLRELVLERESFVKRLRYLHESHGEMLKMIENESPNDRHESDSQATG